MNRVKKTRLTIAVVLLQAACALASAGSEEIVDRSIGALLISHDAMFRHDGGPAAFAGEKLYQQFRKAYEAEIKGLALEERFRFLWAAMWHLGFDGHAMEEFQELVLKDCGDLFIERLENYVKAESELQRDKSRLHLSQKVLAGMKKARSQDPAGGAK